MVDMKTEPEATSATTTTTTTPAAMMATIKQETDLVSDTTDPKMAAEAGQTSSSDNDNNNNGSAGVAGEQEHEDEDEVECENDGEEGSTNQTTVSKEDNDNEKTNLIVNYLPQQMTDEDFEELFKKFGQMKSCKIVRNRVTGYSYGFGFVDYETHEQALKAIEELNGQEVDTKKIKVAFARPAGQDIKQANLYVKNVPSSWSQEDVRKIFEPYGSIIQVRVLGNDRGVAFVLFDLRKQAQDALDALNGKQVDGCDAPFEIKFAAEKKGEKQRGSRGGANRNSNRRGGNRGGNSGGGRNNQNNNNNNNNNNNYNNNSNNNHRNNRSNSNNRRDRSQGRGGNSFSKNNNNNSNGFGNNGGIGPMRQQQNNRSNRYAPFVPVQQPQPAIVTQPAPMTPYGYAQQPILPYMMPGQTMMQMPLSQQPLPMSSAPVNPYSMSAPMGPIGYAQPPIAQPSAAINNMYNVASTTMNNAAQMQPQLGQPMNMRGSSSSGGGGGGGGGGGNQNDGVTLFVYNIGPDCDENELRGMFTPYGTVTRCNVVRKTPGGETKGFGFVTLKNRDNASAAIASLNNSMRNGRSLQVSFKK